MSKREELLKLKEEMGKDETLSLKKGANKLVFGSGAPSTKILFIGEGPGFHEDQQGIPFVGNAGNLLNKLLTSIGLDRNKVFITNVVHHRPPENRDPLPEELLAYGKYLDKIIEIINPKIIVTLGRFSMNKFLPGTKITGIHGKRFDVKWHNRDIIVVPMYHPAAALRNGNVMNQLKTDFLNLPVILEEVNKVEIKQMNLV
jgi:uracil-DNA glycosylase family 4